MLRNNVDRFPFDERTPFEAREAALASFTPRPEPIELTLPFSVDETAERITQYDQEDLISALSPMVIERPYALNEQVRYWAKELQKHIGWTPPEDVQQKLEFGYFTSFGGLSSPDKQELSDLHAYANELTKFGRTIYEQTSETNLSLLSDEVREIAQSPSEDPVFISQKRSDWFARRGIHLGSGDQHPESVVRAHVALQRRRRGVGKVALTAEVEEGVRGTHITSARLLTYYNQAGLLVPERSPEYFSSLLWGIEDPETKEQEAFEAKVEVASQEEQQYDFRSFEGKADTHRRDIILNYACVFGKRQQARRVAKQLLGENSWDLPSRLSERLR